MTVTLTLTDSEAASLREKLGILMREANGVDIWLAGGGVLDVINDDKDKDCFLDCDEEAHFNLGNILTKLGGEFQPHRSSGFSDEEVHTIGNPEALINPTYLWVVFQRSETKPIEEMPITGVYSTRDKAVEAALAYLMTVDQSIASPVRSDEFETVWSFANGQAECVMARMALDY